MRRRLSDNNLADLLKMPSNNNDLAEQVVCLILSRECLRNTVKHLAPLQKLPKFVAILLDICSPDLSWNPILKDLNEMKSQTLMYVQFHRLDINVATCSTFVCVCVCVCGNCCHKSLK